MDVRDGLSRIALNHATSFEARVILQSALEDDSAERMEEICQALRSWTWKVLVERRDDPGMVDWHEILRRVAGRIQERHPLRAAALDMLSQLVHESIASADISTPALVLQRSQNRRILGMLDIAPGGLLPMGELERELSIPSTNVTRLVNMLLAAGLVTKTTRQACVTIEITRKGQTEVAAMRSLDNGVVAPLHQAPVPV